MSLDTDFQAKLTALVSGQTGPPPVQQDYLSVDKTEPRVYWQRRQADTELCLDGTVALADTTYDVEVAGLDPDAVGTIADSVKGLASAGGMQGFRGQMGGSTVLGAWVEDANDDYQPRGLNVDDGYHVAAFSVRLLT